MTLRFLTGGESHGPALTVILDGFPAGLALDEKQIKTELSRRQTGYGGGPRMKLENDHARILSGIMAGYTTGAPIVMMIDNKDHNRWQNKSVNAFTTPRPGHADLTGALKYGYTDLRPALERASARETAARVAVGAVCKQLLAQFNIFVGGYVRSIADIAANLDHISLGDRITLAEQNDTRCPDLETAEKIRIRIREAMNDRDTLGGVIEAFAVGLPVGLGSYVQWDRRLDARLGSAVLSIPAIKGVEIGSAFENTTLPGSFVQDAIHLDEDELKRTTNRAGGLEGGITNGEPLFIRAAMKPVATTLTPQRSVNLLSHQETDTQYERSDFCPVPRAVPIIEAMLAFILAQALIEKLGGDSIGEMLPRFNALRKLTLTDLPMSGGRITFWPSPDDDLSVPSDEKPLNL